LLDNVGGIAGNPKGLGGEATGPEVDCWYGESGIVGEDRGEDVVGRPPKEEETSE